LGFVLIRGLFFPRARYRISRPAVFYRCRVVENLDSYFKIIAKNLPAIQIFSETAETGERVARQDAAQMADYITLVIVFGGLNQDNGKVFARDSPCGGLPGHDVEYSHPHVCPDQPKDRS